MFDRSCGAFSIIALGVFRRPHKRPITRVHAVTNLAIEHIPSDFLAMGKHNLFTELCRGENQPSERTIHTVPSEGRVSSLSLPGSSTGATHELHQSPDEPRLESRRRHAFRESQDRGELKIAVEPRHPKHDVQSPRHSRC